MTDRTERDDWKFAVATVLAASPVWAWVFRGKHGNFWTRMTLAAGSLGLIALGKRPELRHDLPRPVDVLAGLASAGTLYVIFQIGDRLARVVMPAGSEEIAAIYKLRSSAPKPVIAALLVSVIAPSEELFWRGLVQHALMQRFGRLRGTAAAVAAYGGIHLLTGNLTLAGAAGTAGAFWSAVYALQPRLGPVLISHTLWDVWIFLIAPTPGAQGRRDVSP